MLELLSLPDIVLEKILSYLNYDDIARYRIVSIYRLVPLWLFYYIVISIQCESNLYRGLTMKTTGVIQHIHYCGHYMAVN
jgi:hypothetical protein